MSNTHYILVVEDHKKMRETFAWSIDNALYDENLADKVKVVSFGDSTEAYNALFPKEGQPEIDPAEVLCILSDLLLPGEFRDGQDFLNRITTQLGENAPAMVLTSIRENPLPPGSKILFLDKYSTIDMDKFLNQITDSVKLSLEKTGKDSPEV